MLLLSIPKPCHENWSEMSPREHGAFCQACSKTVIDFTSMSDEEVRNYFLKRSGQKTCGRLRNDQLVNPDNLLPRLLDASIPFWKKFLAIVFILFGGFLASCGNNSRENMKGNIPATTEETTTEFTTTLGMLSSEPDSTAVEWGDIIDQRCVGEPIDTGKSEIDPVLVGEIVEVDSYCPAILPVVDSVIKIFDKHGREIKKQAEPEDSSSSPEN
jgi:hypothetical protein